MANENAGQRPLTATVGERLGERADVRQSLAGALPREPGAERAGSAGASVLPREGHRGRWHAAGWLAFFAAMGTWVLADALFRRVSRRVRRAARARLRRSR